MVRKDGTTFAAEGQGSYVVDAEGVPRTVRIMLRDESERVAAEAALRDAEERLEIALQGGDLGLFEVNLQAGEVRILHAASTLALNAEPGVGHAAVSIFNQVHPEDRAKVERAMAAHLSGEREWFEAEFRIRPGEGTGWNWAFVRARVTGATDEGAPALLAGTVVDTSRLRRAEEDRERAETAMRDAQRLESIGTLAAGVAHDFNNLLTAITGNLFLLGEALPKDDVDAQESLRDALHATERGAEVARRLLEFGRPSATTKEALSLGRLVEEALHLARAWDVAGVEVTVTDDGSPDLTWGDPTGIEQALLNLVINALDAVEGTGAVEVERGTIEVSARDGLARAGLAPGRYQCVSVRDSGPGIRPEVRARIFDPFFTTKPVGKGTGLGLWTALGTARSNGGWLDCESSPGHGATFRLILPVAGES
jgi:signal transduction histidine kinase